MTKKWKCLWLFSLLLITTVMQAQTRKIKGKIVDEDQLPLPGVHINIQGKNRATFTDIDGLFEIDAEQRDVIEVKMIGFETVLTTVNGQVNYDIQLKQITDELDELIVVTYGREKKEISLGSNVQINAEQIEKRPNTNVIKSLEGASAGVQTRTGSGQPGSGVTVQIRGTSSYNLSNAPLYIVDGAVFTGSTSDINPDDVASLNILKDAASTSLYGSAASNGVVLITTKKGKKGAPPVFNFTTSTGVVNRGIPEYKRVNAQDYYELNWIALRNGARQSNPNATTEQINEFASNNLFGILQNNIYNVPNNEIVINGQLNPNAVALYDDFNWQKHLQQTGIIRIYNLNYAGATENSNYYASIGYNNEQGYAIKTDFERYSARLNVDTQVTPWLKVGSNLNAVQTSSNQLVSGGSSYINSFYFSRNIGPIYSPYLYDAQGNQQFNSAGDPLFDGIETRGRASSANPGRNVLQEIMLNHNWRTTSTINARFLAEFKLLEHLKFTSNVTYDLQDYEYKTYWNKEIGDGFGTAALSSDMSLTKSITSNQILEFNKNWDQHNLNIIGGHESMEMVINDDYRRKTGEVVSGIYEFSNYLTTTSNIGYSYALAKESYFSRLNYDYANKYIFSSSLRHDKSSRFDVRKNSGTFWSVAAGWNIHRELFFVESENINQLKLRTSYGQVGNDGGIGNQPGYNVNLNLYNVGSYNNILEGGILLSQIGNENLGWESNNQYDVALDFSLLKNRLSGTFEYYNRQTKNMIFAVPKPGSSGNTSIYENIGTLANRGFELSLSLKVVDNKDFKWNLNANATTFTNKMIKMPDGQDEIISGTKRLAVGQSVYDYWLRKWYGVDASNGNPLYFQDPEIDDTASTVTIDDVKYTSNQLDAEYGYAGTANPDVYGSFTNHFEYKGFYLTTMFTYQIGGLTYDSNYATLMQPYPEGNALHVDMKNAWQNPGDITDIPLMTYNNIPAIYAASSRWLVSSDYITFRQANIGYTFDKDQVAKFGATKVNVYLSGENLISWTKRYGMEPADTFTGVPSDRFTPSRVITLGLNASF